MENQPDSIPTKKELLNELFRIGGIKLGSFKLKSGIISPIYIDLRVIISYPSVLSKIGKYMYKTVTEAGAKFDVICGVPYTALPIASSISLEQNIPMLIRRKEGAKDYGTKKALEGVFEKGQTCLVVEDLVTTGGSAIEVAESLRSEGLVINDVVVFLDREQGAAKLLQQKNLRLHSVISMSEMLSILEEEKKLDDNLLKSIRDFISGTQFVAQEPSPPKRITYAEKAKLAQHPVAKQLLKVIEEKKSNLSVAVDVTTKKELLDIVDQVGPSICLLKTHIDIIEDFDADLIEKLKKLSTKHNFLIFEDRKFADIGNTVQLQYEKGIYRIADWAHIVNAHTVPGPGIIDGLKQVGLSKQRALLLLAEMSSEGTLATGGYTEETLRMAKANKDFVIGFVSRKELLPDDPSFLYFTPGVRLDEGKDSLGQTYLTPASVLKSGSDIIIVGRGIYTSGDIAKTAEEYRKAGWDAYQALIQ